MHISEAEERKHAKKWRSSGIILGIWYCSTKRVVVTSSCTIVGRGINSKMHFNENDLISFL